MEGYSLNKRLFMGAGITGLALAVLTFTPVSTHADIGSSSIMEPGQGVTPTTAGIGKSTIVATGDYAKNTTVDNLPVKTQSVEGNQVTVTVHSDDPNLNGKTITKNVDLSSIYPGNDNSAQSLLDSVNDIINGSLDKMVQGRPNVISALTIGLPQTVLNMLGNVTSSSDVLGDFSRGLTSIIDQFNTQFPMGIISTGISAVGSVVSDVTGYISKSGGKVDLTGLQSKTEDKVPENSTKLPIMKLSGNEFLADKSNHSTMTFDYSDPKTGKDEKGYAEVNWSGSSTQLLPKKSYKVKLFKDQQLTDKLKLKLFADAKKDNTYQLKANETDPTMARNLVNAGIWKSMVSSEQNVPEELKSTPNFGSVEGFPMLVFVNGKGRGLYTLTTDKSGDLWGMDKKNPDQVAIQGNVNSAPAEMFDKGNAKVDDTDFSSESSDTISDSAKNNLNDFITFVSNSSDQAFKEGLSHYANIDSIIDYYLFVNILGAYDQIAKNATYLSYDGGKTWRMTAYDNDLTLGNYIFGLGINEPYAMYYNAARGGLFPSHNTLLRRVAQLFGPQITARYDQLRKSGVISADTINNQYVDFMSKVGYDNYTYDQDINPLEINQYTQGLPALQKVVTQRIQTLDNHFGYTGN
ncbi:spore coat protein CotH [Lentilactobacillus hilgardii]|nr:spore coat protein CotH [Lentilactobacillus hilgardii]